MLKLSKTSQGAVIKVKVSVGSNEFAVDGYDSWANALKIRVKSQAKKEKANLEIERELGKITECKAKIIQGRHSSTKTVELIGNKKRALSALESALRKH